MKLVAALLLVSMVTVFGLPLKTEKDPEWKLLQELRELQHHEHKTEGKAVEHIKQANVVEVNGEKQAKAEETVKVADPKSAKVLAEITKTESQKNDEPVQTQVELKEPAKKSAKVDAESDDGIPAEEVAAYLMETGDIESFKTALNQLVKDHKMSLKDAEEYASNVRSVMTQIDEDAEKEHAEKEDEEFDNAALESMVEAAIKIKDIPKWQAKLYSAAKILYKKANMEDDATARIKLSEFTNLIKSEADEGSIDREQENDFYDILLLAVSDADREMEEMNKSDDEDADEEENELHVLSQQQNHN